MGKSTHSAKVEPVTASSNWKQLKQALQPASPQKNSSRKRSRSESVASITKTIVAPPIISKGKERAREEQRDESMTPGKKGSIGKGMVPVDDVLKGNVAAWQMEVGQYLAIDCEMVGVGPEGVESTLARVSIVNYHGAVMLDSFVRPREKVTDYRTWVSGVREEDLLKAPTFAEVIKKVSELIKDRILIGHALSNDTQVLLLSHPHHLTRDTSKYAPLQALARTKRPGLKTLAQLVLGVEIQSGEHSSIDDARATMAIYRSQKSAWEESIKTKVKPKLVYGSTEALKEIERRGGVEALGRSGAGAGGGGAGKKSMGIAQTLRLVRAREMEEREGEAGMMEEEGLEERQRKKARVEEVDGLVLGFDYAPVQRTKVAQVARKDATVNEDGAAAKRKLAKKVKKVVTGGKKMTGGGDAEKRPKSQEGWWEEE